MGSYGQETFEIIGSGITVTADGAPIAKAAGVTVVWSAVPAVNPAGAATEHIFKNEDHVLDGEKFIRYGTVLCKITAATDTTEIGKYMPFMGSPGGGRTLSVAKGDVFITNESTHENDRNSNHPPVIDGGRVYKKRLLVVGYGDGTEANTTDVYAGSPTENAADLTVLGVTAFVAATFATAFPMITFVTEN